MRTTLTLAALVLAQAPQPQLPPPTFKSSTALVEVDIIARDKSGAFASGLTADDIEVYEEGKPQRVQHFYLVTEQPGSPRELPADLVLPRSPDRTERRVFVFFFDSPHLEPGRLLRLKQHAVEFVNEHLRRADLAGVFVNGSLVHGHLTNARQELLDSIASVTPAIDTSETRSRTLTEFPRIDSYFEAARIDSGDRSAVDEVATRDCGGDQARQCSAEGGREFVEEMIQRKARLFMDESRRAAASTLQSLQYVVHNLSRLEGRKTLVLLSEGFNVETVRSDLPMVAGQAARAGITIYGIDARGTRAHAGVSAGDASSATAGLSGFGDTTDEGLDILANETGGVTIRHLDDYSRALNDIATDTSTYYVLAYSPENAALDGKYRKIDVKVKWGGLSVRARHGYVATPLPAPKQLRTAK